VELVGTVRPDVVLMDIRMPQLDGLSATERLMALPEPPRVVVLTTFDQNEYVVRALRAGAYGLLLKDAPASRLMAAVCAAASGEALIEPSITRRLIERFAVPDAEPDGIPPAMHSLTDRELEVLRLMARGLSNAEIADAIVVAETTVKTHVARILMKLGVRPGAGPWCWPTSRGSSAGGAATARDGCLPWTAAGPASPGLPCRDGVTRAASAPPRGPRRAARPRGCRGDRRTPAGRASRRPRRTWPTRGCPATSG